MKIKVICKSFALPRGRKSFADHFDFRFDGKFRQTDGKIMQMQKNFFQFDEFFRKTKSNCNKIDDLSPTKL